MPDNVYPKEMQELLDKLHQIMLRGATPRPASTNPTFDAAINEIKKQYPREVNAADIREMPWSNPYANTNVMGLTHEEQGPSQRIEINPALSLLGTQKAIEGTVRHEIEHVNQQLNAPPEYFGAISRAGRNMIPYEDRPNEISAAQAALDWLKKRKVIERDQELSMLNRVIGGRPTQVYQSYPAELLPKSPLVKD